MKGNQINDKDFLKFLEQNKDQKSQIELRLFDNKHGKVFYKTLTYKELVRVMASVNIEWNNLPKKEVK